MYEVENTYMLLLIDNGVLGHSDGRVARGAGEAAGCMVAMDVSLTTLGRYIQVYTGIYAAAARSGPSI